jgi:hypothetical protein
MAAQNNKYEKIWLALIPVIGAIIIAYINYKPSGKEEKESPGTVSKSLHNKAGKINEIAVYNNYNELYPHLSEMMQVNLTKEIFHAANDSMRYHLGNYIKPIDTTQNIMNGSTFYYIKNQYQNGLGITTLQFDNNDKLIFLYYNKVPR